MKAERLSEIKAHHAALERFGTSHLDLSIAHADRHDLLAAVDEYREVVAELARCLKYAAIAQHEQCAHGVPSSECIGAECVEIRAALTRAREVMGDDRG